ncbi:MAG: hypothetical protein GY820_20050, partial [Gammaproteobacteria bacterium]|nr:hypothetical protein [Gammaproteobacteria bacterium]
MKPNQEEELSGMWEMGSRLADEIVEKMAIVEMDEADANIINYVAGALVRSEVDQHKCISCKAILVDSASNAKKTLPSTLIDGEICEDVCAFLNQIKRGDLFMPTPVAFGVYLKFWLIFT